LKEYLIQGNFNLKTRKVNHGILMADDMALQLNDSISKMRDWRTEITTIKENIRDSVI
jgi:hypothetical protein